ncbi:hypothetical protein DPMN_161578 [Dreissena polymorpha]|uniref:Uncharacterized protein n=1 Tax=Dreissena polymorpha TaxID=45954 RepID=A0A9D4IPS8_DREPO|nr:hypothetical protein DPMN_161578 [Dreissena polymorpha]
MEDYSSFLSGVDFSPLDYGIQHTLSKDRRARLMYYIYRICSILNLPETDAFTRFSDYVSFREIGDEHLQELLDTAYMLRPKVLDGICMFVNDEMCMQAGYAVILLPTSHSSIGVAESYVDIPTIGSVEIMKVMMVKESWIRYMFTRPFTKLREDLRVYRLNMEEDAYVKAEEEAYVKAEEERFIHEQEKGPSCLIC